MIRPLFRPAAAFGLGLLILSSSLGAAGAQSAGAPRAAASDVSAVLFEGEHFRAAAPTATLRYAYKRTSKDAERLRPSVEDIVELKLEPGGAPEKRNISVVMFQKPANHRAAGPFDDIAFNPVVILMLEHHLGDFAKILRGNSRYFKNAIRAGMRDRAVAEPVKITVGGREVDATRITVKPFEADPQRERFGPLAATTYMFTWSDAVPGLVHEIRIVTPDPAGGEPLLEEVTRHVEN